MLDRRSSWPANNHDDVWDLIPWYVNGSLPSEDFAAIERHVTNCPECALEVSRQREISRQIAGEEPCASAAARSWTKLSSQIRSERGLSNQRQAPLSLFAGSRRGLMLGGAFAAACMLAVFAFLPDTDDFHTLTSPVPADGIMIKFQTVPGIAPEQVGAILREHQLELVSGPSASGVYIAAQRQGVADPQAFAETLMNAPQIIFAAPAE